MNTQGGSGEKIPGLKISPKTDGGREEGWYVRAALKMGPVDVESEGGRYCQSKRQPLKLCFDCACAQPEGQRSKIVEMFGYHERHLLIVTMTHAMVKVDYHIILSSGNDSLKAHVDGERRWNVREEVATTLENDFSTLKTNMHTREIRREEQEKQLHGVPVNLGDSRQVEVFFTGPKGGSSG